MEDNSKKVDLTDPEVVKFLEEQGFKKEPEVNEEDEVVYTITFGDGVTRTLVWDNWAKMYVADFIAVMRKEDKNAMFSPIENHMHFAFLLYALCIGKMHKQEEPPISCQDFVELIPLERHFTEKLLNMVIEVVSRDSKKEKKEVNKNLVV